MSEQQENKRSHCENCGVSLQGHYCHACGQASQSSFRFFGSILMDLLDNLFNYDSRVFRTLIPLMTRPGFVCNEYLSGRRIRYLPPFRLYLFASIMFFLIAPMGTDVSYSAESADAENDIVVPGDERLAEVIASRAQDTAGTATAKEEQNEISLPFLSQQQNEALTEKFQKAVDHNAEDLVNATLNNLPTMMIFLLPVFALALKLLYLFSKRYYMEHVIVVLYSQSYLFFMLLFILAFDNAGDFMEENYPSLVLLPTITSVIVTLSSYWLPLHLFLIQKRVYGQSMTLTLFKFFTCALIYVSLLGITLGLAILWGVISI